MSNKLILNGENLKIEALYEASNNLQTQFELASSARKKMQDSRNYIESRLKAGEVMYGVNTGFGAFSSVRISDAQIEELQVNLIRSHSSGVGTPFSKIQTRGMMILRANALARGHSGIRPAVVEKILEFLNHDIIPVVPSQGSVGASGDLAPLSHLALGLIGEGKVWPGVAIADILKSKKISPLSLKAKEGLSLINGCQVMTAVGLLAATQARDLVLLADVAGALSLEALRGSRKAFHPLIADTRPHPGEKKTAQNLLKILEASSEISKTHENCNKVQDAYSLRCMPAVHGAVKEGLRRVIEVLEIEANSSTDNPLVFSEEDQILSCGNFHGMPVAFQMDFAGILFSSLASISEARISKLINPAMSELPAFLAPQGGLHSGHMIVQVAAASLVSENKVLAHPACVDTIPTSADKEDHVSMGTISARKFTQILENVANVIAMEFLCASQGLDLLKPSRPGKYLQAVHELIRTKVPFADRDRVFAEDILKIRELMDNQQILQVFQKNKIELSW